MTDSERSAARAVWLQFYGRHLGGDPKPFEELCAEHPRLAEELRRCHVESSAPAPVEAKSQRSTDHSDLNALMLRLARPAGRGRRYEIECDIGRGSMGVVQRVWDRDLQRQLAMKTMNARVGGHWKQLATRFIEEAQIIAQLDHPSIVPVHDLGIDEFGRPFFVMKLVNGQQLTRIFELAWEREQGWSTARVLRCLLDVCEAVGYAHSKGVVHRDLKPSNVMVGARGEVHVMDWGVARVLGTTLRQRDATESRSVVTLRSARAEDETGSIFTSHGQIVGTAAYMFPEQARGAVKEVDARSDVYAVGAMLYHYLAKRMPYGTQGDSTEQVLEQVRAGPPRPLRSLAREESTELVAICEQAMSREPSQRYANLAECADDLRAYLELRVVRAHRGGRVARLGKWVRRRPTVAASLLLVTVGAPTLIVYVADAEQKRERYSSLTRLQRPVELMESFGLLWPATREREDELREWLAAAEEVERLLPFHREELSRAESRGSVSPAILAADRKLELELRRREQRSARLIEVLKEQLAELDRTGDERTFDGSSRGDLEVQIERDTRILHQRRSARATSLAFDTDFDRVLHERLGEVFAAADWLASSRDGLSPVERVRRALTFMTELHKRDSTHEARVWSAAIESIANIDECPLYKGLRIQPQEGLVPLCRNSESTLWEFAHLQSGVEAELGPTGQLELAEDSGIVLVLVPGGWYRHGCQSESKTMPNYDPDCMDSYEGPLTPVLLKPFFISKYELTHAQWVRWTGLDPRRARGPESLESDSISPLSPVAHIDWIQADRCLRELNLALPSEAQWEHTARAGSSTPWSFGESPWDAPFYANLSDDSRRFEPGHREGAPWAAIIDPITRNDACPRACAVGQFAPNAWGLYDVHGNVSEWCRDRGMIDFATGRWPDTGERTMATSEGRDLDDGGRVARGGSWNSAVLQARISSRLALGERARRADVGIRPARALDP